MNNALEGKGTQESSSSWSNKNYNSFPVPNMLPNNQQTGFKRDTFLDSYLSEVPSIHKQLSQGPGTVSQLSNSKASSYNPMLDLASHLPTAAEIAASAPQIDTHNRTRRAPPGNELGEYSMSSLYGGGGGVSSPLSSPVLGPSSSSYQLNRGSNGFQLSPPSQNTSEYLMYNQFPQRNSLPQIPRHADLDMHHRVTSIPVDPSSQGTSNLTNRKKRKSSSSFNGVDGGVDSPRTGDLQNRKTIKTGPKSKYRGVSWKTDRNAWAAGIMINGKHLHLGYFDNEVEAARSYDRKNLELRGAEAQLNFSDESQEDFKTSKKPRKDGAENPERTPKDGTLKSDKSSDKSPPPAKATSRHVKHKAARTSQYRGVIWDKNSRAWRAKLSVNGKLEHIGLFDVEEDAAKAWDLRAVAVRGKRARLNFPAFVAQVEKLGPAYPIHFESQRVRGGLRGYGISISSVPKATHGLSPEFGGAGNTLTAFRQNNPPPAQNQLLGMYPYGIQAQQQFGAQGYPGNAPGYRSGPNNSYARNNSPHLGSHLYGKPQNQDPRGGPVRNSSLYFSRYMGD